MGIRQFHQHRHGDSAPPTSASMLRLLRDGVLVDLARRGAR